MLVIEQLNVELVHEALSTRSWSYIGARRGNCSLSGAGHDFKAVILNVCTGSAMPFRVSSPIGSASTMSSIRLKVF